MMTVPVPDGAAPDMPGRRTPFDAQRVRGVNGILDDLNEIGILDAADLHMTRRLRRLSGESGSPAADLGIALTVRSVRLGSTCLSIRQIADVIDTADRAGVGPLPRPDEIVGAIAGSVLVRGGGTTGPLRPLVVMDSDDGALIYFRKYFGQEQLIRETLENRSRTHPLVDEVRLGAAIERVFTPRPGEDHEPETDEPDRQRMAAALAARRWITVLAGGPGTGKTYTVSRILAVLDELSDGTLRIGVCAPTGRAAAQVQAAIVADDRAPRDIRAVTVHSMLGWRPGSVPRHGPGNRLPFDVVVVDETSMLPMTAMSALLAAVRATTRVILVGDPHQLASVEAGAVLADLVEAAGGASASDSTGVVTLTRGYRFGGSIVGLAEAINHNDADTVMALLGDESATDVSLIAPDSVEAVRPVVVEWAHRLRRAAHAGDDMHALDCLDAHRVLCAHREGAWGVQGWSQRIGRWLAETPDHRHLTLDGSIRYAGQPLLVTANDRRTGTFNGDCGVVVAGDSDDDLHVAFRRGPQLQRLFPTQLADVVPVYAMTIHRSQGSQFDSVTVVLPPEGSELLTRELLYTAATRARKEVRIVGTESVIRAAIARPVTRASGLRSPIRPWGGPSVE